MLIRLRVLHPGTTNLLLLPGTETLLWGLVDPDALLGVEGGYSIESSVRVARADGVDADLVTGPLGGEGLGEL